MNSEDDLKTQYREAFDETLNHLQTVNLLVAQIEIKMDEIRKSMQNLGEIVEEIFSQSTNSTDREQS